MSNFTPVSSSLVDAVVSSDGAVSPLIANVPLIANTEASYTFPDNTRSFLIKLRDAGVLQVAYTLGDTATTYITVPKYNWHSVDNLKTSSLTIYFQTPASGQILEILSWT